MKADIVIRGARVVTHAGEFYGGAAASDGVIVAIGSDEALPAGRRSIDAGGRVLMPGVIDPHCHLARSPYDEDVRAETAHAASGGLTTILVYIRTHDASYIPFYRERASVGEENAYVDFGFHFGIQREEHVREIPQIAAETGVRSFKLYFGYQPDNPIGIVPANDGWVYATMSAAARLEGGVVSVHCENTDIAVWLGNEIKAAGRQDLPAYTESRPAFVEVETVQRMIYLAELTGCPFYIVHTTAARSAEVAAQARARGVDVTVETCPHYLTLTAYDDGLDVRAKVTPPLHDEEEKERLWRAVMNGTITSLGSDHVAAPDESKPEDKDVWKARPGLVSFPWELALMLSEGHHRRGIPLTRLVSMNSYTPARRFNLYPRKGVLQPGADADLVLVDLDEEREVVHDGRGKCIYEGMRLRGWPVMTVLRGQVIYEDNEVDPDAVGRGACVTRPLTDE